MSPIAMKLVQSDGKCWAVYQFFDVAVNADSRFPVDDPFHAATPKGWTKVVE